MKSSGGQGPTCQNYYHVAAFPEKADTKGKRGAFPLDKTEGSTGPKIPALEHIMLSQAGKTVVPSKISDVCQ